MGKSHILRLKLLLSLISGAGGRGFVLKGPSGADLNKERADGFLTRTNTHAHSQRYGFALGASRGQYDSGCKVKYFHIPSLLLLWKKKT